MIDLSNDFKQALYKIPRKIGIKAENKFKSNFVEQGYDGKKWKEVQRRIPGTRAYKSATPAERSKAILVDSGKLKRSIRVTKVSLKSVTIASNVPYAEYHNEGTPKIPKRQFMGIDKELEEDILDTVVQELDKFFGDGKKSIIKL